MDMPDIDAELREWIRIAEEQLRQDLAAKKSQIEIDRINRAACERAEVLCCRVMLAELDEQLSRYQWENRLTST